MWIEQMEIHGFRRIAGSFSFSPKLTLVVGDNESGKSSLHEALIRTLFGFSKAERRKTGGRSLLERLAPWDGSAYALEANVHDDEGRAQRIEWDFEKHRVTLVDDLGKDISDQIRGKGDEIMLGPFLLGVELDDFREVCCMDQVSLAAVRHSPSLGVALQEAVANIGGDTPVEHAIERMNEFLRTAIGARIDTLKPSPTGKLNTLASERGRLVDELRSKEETREELVGLARDQGKASDKLNELVAEQELVRQRLLFTDLHDLEQRQEEVARLSSEEAERPSERTLPPDVVEDVKSALARLDELAVELTEVDSEIETIAPEIAGLESEQRRLASVVDGLEVYAAVDASARESVHGLWERLDALRGQTVIEPPVRLERDEMLARYRGERGELLALATANPPTLAKRIFWILLVLLSLGLAFLARKLVRRMRGRLTGELAERLAVYGASTLEELDERVAAEDLRIAKAQAVTDAFREGQERREKTQRELEEDVRAALDSVSATEEPELERRVSAYLTAASRHAERKGHEADLERVRRQLEEKRRPVHHQLRLVQERERLEARLKQSCNTLGIEASDLELARREFIRLVETDAAAARTTQKADAAATALQAVLGDETMESLGRRVEEARRLRSEHVAAFGELTAETGSPEQLKAEVGKLEGGVRAKRDTVTSLETRISSLEIEAGDPARLKEELAAIEERLRVLDEAKEAVRLARETLTQAADELKRQFAPHLNDALRRSLPRITGGRYTEGMVDGELRVSVVAPEIGRLISAEELSRATKDQIFLVQRLEIARLLSPTKGRAPLLLDDPFAHYDDKRLKEGLELVREAANERQVVLFSEDRELVELAGNIEGGCEVIDLDAS